MYVVEQVGIDGERPATVDVLVIRLLISEMLREEEVSDLARPGEGPAIDEIADHDGGEALFRKAHDVGPVAPSAAAVLEHRQSTVGLAILCEGVACWLAVLELALLRHLLDDAARTDPRIFEVEQPSARSSAVEKTLPAPTYQAGCISTGVNPPSGSTK